MALRRQPPRDIEGHHRRQFRLLADFENVSFPDTRD